MALRMEPAFAAVSEPGVTSLLVFDHLGLIVPDLAEGRAFLRTALGIVRWTEPVDDVGLGVSVQFGSAAGGTGPVYELVAPLGAASPITGQLGRGKGVLNHLAYRTDDFEASAAHLRSTGCFAAADPKPARAYGGALVQFWVSPLRFLIELIAKAEHEHSFEDQSLHRPHSEGSAEPGQ